MALFGKNKNSAVASVSKPKSIGYRLASGAVLVPVVSEKAARLQQLGQYMFSVSGQVSKLEIKKAVESSAGVRVIGVNSIGLPGKFIRRGRQLGQRSKRHHLIVRLAKGDSLDLSKTL